MPLAVLRADASVQLGGGHVMRCIALAAALRAAGWRTRLACRAETLRTVPAAAAETPLLLADDMAEAEAIARALDPAGGALLVVDHYGWGAAEYRAARQVAARIAAIADAPGQAEGVDLVIDPTPGRAASAHGGAGRVLAGAAWTPLRPGLRARRAGAHARRAGRPHASRVLVAMGMTDAADATSAVLEALANPASPVTVDVVLGAAAPHRARIAASLPSWARLHADPPDPFALVRDADLAVGAGGVGALERACLGLPQILIEVAANQRDAIAGLVAAGAARPARPGSLAADAGALLADPAALAAMSARAFLACDGLGALRSAIQLAPAADRAGRAVTLRPAEPGDRARTLDWQLSPGMRRFARDPAPPAPDAHAAWFARRLSDPLGPFSIIEVDAEPAGVLRHDRLAGDAERYEVSIMIDPRFQGSGVGRAALGLGRRLLPDAAIVAAVLPGNAASAAMFRAAGFRPAPGGFESLPEHAA